MSKWLNFIIIFFLYILNGESIFSQNLSWKNYTTDHGLPGNEVYDQLLDSRGYMWFATNHGICRFNGYEFIQPVDTSHLSGTEAFLPTEDNEGNIWFTRLDGSIWKVENDTIRAWKYNVLIAPYVAKSRPIVNMYFAKNAELWLTLHIHGFLVVSPDGEVKEIKRAGDDYFLIAKTDDKDLYTMCFLQSSKAKPAFKPRRNFKLIFWKNRFIDSELEFQVDLPQLSTYLEHVSLSDNAKLLCLGRQYFYIRNDTIAFQVKLPFYAGKVISTQKGKILIPSHSGTSNGLFRFESMDDLKAGNHVNLLPNQFVTRVLEDEEGGYWASTHHAGVFYCKNPNFEILNKASGLSADDIVCLSDDGSKNIYLGTRPAGIIKYDSDLKTMSNIPGPSDFNREVNIIYFDTLNDKIYANELLHVYKRNSWSPMGQKKNGVQSLAGFPVKTLNPAPDGHHIWSSSFSGFAKIDTESDTLELLGYDSLMSGKERTFSVVQDKRDVIWVTTTSGLRIWKNNKYEMPPFTHPMLHHQPRNILITGDGSMLFSLSGNGILIRNVNDEWQHLNLKDGLVSNNISKFYLSRDDIIYACSSAGLSMLSKYQGIWKITNITEKDGLPSNQVNDVIKLNGILWIATNKGLVKLRNLPTVKAMPSPILEKLWINNKNVSIQNNVEFAYNENNITLRFYALHYRSDGRIPYRFRLSGADSVFTNSNTREVNFANLAPGKYLFQVQAQNEAGEWGSMTEWPFVIRAAWWQTIWFYGFSGFLIAGIFAVWYRERLQKKQHELEISTQIKDLEAAALRAQMNPHFIFNSLSSIQHFIAENDKDAAISYLAKFARLVRLALHGSVDGQHTLREEIEMLEYYLALEKLRFRGKFNFLIKIADEIDPDDISIPPMLIQPFVENALLHGMKNKTVGGRIEITFALKDNILKASITDNGPGIHSIFSKADGEGHKSVGMTLTKHRLEILSEQGIKDSYMIQEIKSDDGTVIGTSVTLSIPLI